MNIAWIAPWDRPTDVGDYTRILWPRIEEILRQKDQRGIILPIEKFPNPADMVQRLLQIQPNIIHFQHDYNTWGGKELGAYTFPKVVRLIKRYLPKARLIATAHEVLPPDYRIPLRGGMPEKMSRWVANRVCLGRMKKVWIQDTWQHMDRVIVHSRLQMGQMYGSKVKKVEVIPHYVNGARRLKSDPPVKASVPHQVMDSLTRGGGFVILVFGAYAETRGQDIALRAFAQIIKDDPEATAKVHMLFAGEMRGSRDFEYHRKITGLAKGLGLGSRTTFITSVDRIRIEGLFAGASLVLAPFLETRGAGALRYAFGRAKPILASNLPFFLEIEQEVRGCMGFFAAGDVGGCAEELLKLIRDSASRDRLASAALEYANSHRVDEVAQSYVLSYKGT